MTIVIVDNVEKIVVVKVGEVVLLVVEEGDEITLSTLEVPSDKETV
jgi:hypothetical protein